MIDVEGDRSAARNVVEVARLVQVTRGARPGGEGQEVAGAGTHLQAMAVSGPCLDPAHVLVVAVTLRQDVRGQHALHIRLPQPDRTGGPGVRIGLPWSASVPLDLAQILAERPGQANAGNEVVIVTFGPALDGELDAAVGTDGPPQVHGHRDVVGGRTDPFPALHHDGVARLVPGHLPQAAAHQVQVARPPQGLRLAAVVVDHRAP